MKSNISKFILLLFGIIINSNLVYSQKEVTDTVEAPKLGVNAVADSLFFEAIKAKTHDDAKLATELYEKFIKIKPNVSGAYFELAKLNYNDRKAENAETNIKKAIDLDGNNKWYKKEYATMLADRSAFESAAKVIAELVKTHPNDEDLPIIAAEYYEHAKKYEDAIIYLDKAILRSGNEPEILMRKVQIFLELNDIDHAAESIKVLIAKDPRNGRYYKALGEIYDNNKLPEKATKMYDSTLKILGNDPSIQLGYAEHCLKMGDTDLYKKFVKKAIVNKEFESELQMKLLDAYLQNLATDSIVKLEGMPIILQLLEQHPNDADILAFYGDFLENDNQRDKAIDVYKKSISINASKFNVWIKLLQNYTDKNEADSLIKYSEKAIRMFPNQALASYFNGIGHYNKLEYPAAIKAINRAIDLQPESKAEFLAAMYSTLGDIYNVTKQYELSDNAFEKSLHFDPTNASVLNNYSYYLSERGLRLDEAEKMSKKSLQLKPGESTYLDTYGWILYKQGDYTGAKEYIEKAIEKIGTRIDGTLYDHIGNIYFKLNKKEKAIENWKIAKEKGADSPLLDKKIGEGKLYE